MTRRSLVCLVDLSALPPFFDVCKDDWQTENQSSKYLQIIHAEGEMLLCGFVIGLNKFKPTAPTRVVLWPFSLLPSAEQSDLPCADSVAHSTATQGSTAGKHLCWKAATQQKTKQLLSPRLNFPVPRCGLPGSKREGWECWLVVEGTEWNQSSEQEHTQRLV